MIRFLTHARDSFRQLPQSVQGQVRKKVSYAHTPFPPTSLPPMLPNYQSNDSPNPSTRAHLVIGIALPFYVLTFLMVSARILVKSKLGKLGVDDFLIGISMVR